MQPLHQPDQIKEAKRSFDEMTLEAHLELRAAGACEVQLHTPAFTR